MVSEWIQALRNWTESTTVDRIADEVGVDKLYILSHATLLQKLCKHDSRASEAGRLIRELVASGHTISLRAQLQSQLELSDFALECFLHLHADALKSMHRPKPSEACRKVVFTGPLILFANHLLC
jgi:hypothetical protein